LEVAFDPKDLKIDPQSKRSIYRTLPRHESSTDHWMSPSTLKLPWC